MTKVEFAKAMEELFAAFERNTPPPGTLAVWYSRVSHIDAQQISKIVDNIIRTEPRYPSNMTLSILDRYQKPPTEVPAWKIPEMRKREDSKIEDEMMAAIRSLGSTLDMDREDTE